MSCTRTGCMQEHVLQDPSDQWPYSTNHGIRELFDMIPRLVYVGLVLGCLTGAATPGKETAEFMNIILSRRSSPSTNGTDYRGMKVYDSKIHLVRIPKAGSTSMSAVVRRLIGCTPAGPCCRYPGSPKGSCPATSDRPDMFMCQRVVGCVGHNPHADRHPFSKSESLITVSMLREPIARAISAFFYHPPHTNCELGNCPNRDAAFGEYLRNPIYQNVAVKMLSGTFPYRNVTTGHETGEYSLKNALRILPKFDFMGIMELWSLSILVMHLKIPIFEPDQSDFSVTSTQMRLHAAPDYSKAAELYKLTYSEALVAQNQWDIELYKYALNNLCEELHQFGLWRLPAIIHSWTVSVPPAYARFASRCLIEVG